MAPRKAAKLEKVEIFKKRPLQLIAAKLGSAGTKPFWLNDVPELRDYIRVGQISISTL